MAKPISETPVLKGEDAKRFLQSMQRPRDPEAVQKERERVLRNYNSIKSTSSASSSSATK